jgi:hypothetical protein
MKTKLSIVLMFVLMLFASSMMAQNDGTPAGGDSKAACACCNHTGANAQSCCKDGKGCDMKDGKMACRKDCCKDMAKGKSCCKHGKCEMAKASKSCCGESCKMKSKAS